MMDYTPEEKLEAVYNAIQSLKINIKDLHVKLDHRCDFLQDQVDRIKECIPSS